MPPDRSEPITVLVTGVGAPAGVSIFKALRSSTLRPRIVGTDADPLSVGLFRADAGYVLPRVDRDPDGYRRRLEEICRDEDVRLVCFGSDPEMHAMAPHVEAFEGATPATLVTNEPGVLGIFLDKWSTYEALHGQGLPVPDTVPAADQEAVRGFLARHDFPFILKPRRGSGSKGVVLLRDEEELAWFSRYTPDPVLQERLLPDDQEYTVGLYRSRRSGVVAQICFKRTLAAGLTYKAEVVHDREIAEVCARLVTVFDLWGPVNVQLRKTDAGVGIFEVNCRFSSTVVMRASFGFNEPELCIRDLVLEEPIAQPEIRSGFALRYWDEVYVDEAEFAHLRDAGRTVGPGGRIEDDF